MKGAGSLQIEFEDQKKTLNDLYYYPGFLVGFNCDDIDSPQPFILAIVDPTILISTFQIVLSRLRCSTELGKGQHKQQHTSTNRHASTATIS